jgi:hypothetical protein
MGPSSAEAVPTEGALAFGNFLVRVNSKKHKNGDRIIIRIGRGPSAKSAEWFAISVLLLDGHDPSAEAEDVARYLQLKIGALSPKE